MDYQLFKEIGFTDREIKVYLALIELGSTTVGPLSNKTRLQPSKVYETLEKLKDKGMVSYTVVSKTKHFQASNPKEILEMLDEKKRQFKEVVEELEQKQKFTSSQQLAVVHEGYKAFKALFNRIIDTLGPKDHYWAFGFREGYQDQNLALFLRNVHFRLAEKKVDDRLLGHISMKKEILKSHGDNNNYKIRFNDHLTPLGVVIIQGKVINLLWGERPTAIEITSEQVYQQYKEFFLELWNKSKP
ncbi:MAG: helix-turn-helix domain-containing protein [Candidatus Woesearchaeota archaeon]|jgi:predicted transcriptional regulator